MERTAKAIREALQGQGRVYFRELLTSETRRVFGARERKGETQVQLHPRPGSNAMWEWHTLLNGDEVWGVGQ